MKITSENAVDVLQAMLEVLKTQQPNRFNQPTQTFSIYDIGSPSVKPDTGTPVRKAAVEFENSIRHETIEHGAFFSATGDLITTAHGNTDSLTFKLSHAEKKAVYLGTMTHNHPNGYTFSIEDLTSACYYKLSEIRIVTPYHRYIMQLHNHWHNREIIEKLIYQLAPKANQITHLMVVSSIINVRDASHEVTHQLMLLLSRQLGWLYIQEKS